MSRLSAGNIADPPDRQFITERVRVPLDRIDLELAEIVQRARPRALRSYDQIPMLAQDLVRQAKLIAPYLAGESVAFVGDFDGTSLILGLLSRRGTPRPFRMLVLDFDERTLAAAERVAAEHHFDALYQFRRYNVFEPVPPDLLGQYDWFYTNPPYGSRNNGASARLFIARGYELAHPTTASGCVILPYDASRPWTCQGMLETQRFQTAHGWAVREKVDRLHRYHLDDDAELTSSLVLVDRIAPCEDVNRCSPYAGRHVGFDEIPSFYGRQVLPPYLRYIRENGAEDYEWGELAS